MKNKEIVNPPDQQNYHPMLRALEQVLRNIKSMVKLD